MTDRHDALARHLSWLEHLPPGWHDLYRRLAGQLAANYPSIDVAQAKQKFGRLRVYLDRAGDGTARICLDAERESARICEVCSAPARLMVDDHGWYRTLCAAHAGELGFKAPPARR